MILWIGGYKGHIGIRCLGQDGLPSRCFRVLGPYKMVSKVLKHNECTTRRDGTSPGIGAGESKKCRDYGIMGFSVGTTVGSPSKEPIELNDKNCCIMAYDIECEYAGPTTTGIDSAMLCIALKCTCGFKHMITRSRIIGMDCEQSVRVCNRSMVIRTMDLIIQHRPVFTVGHNVYAFDNPTIAKALPSNHIYRSYFQAVQKSDTKSSTTMGLVMTIPGINNLDTYKYIYHSMYDRFAMFSLEYLSKVLEVPLPKISNENTHFCIDWYSASFANSLAMATCNMRDCDATLGVCNKLDIINQVVSLCYVAKAWIRDVMLYNTGAMALSSMCSIAWTKGYRYNWTRCDWIPNVFSGGHVFFTSEKVRRNVAIVDFSSMYPTLIRDGGISPECIDFVDVSSRYVPRFDHIVLAYTSGYDRVTKQVYVGIVGLGINRSEQTDTTGIVIIGEYSNIVNVGISDPKTIILEVVSEFGQYIKDVDNTLHTLDIDILAYSQNNPIEDNTVFDWYLGYSRRLCLRCIREPTEYKYAFSPTSNMFVDGMVDWNVGPLATTMVFATEEYVARFPPGPRVCAQACQTLMDTRKEYKRLMRNARSRTLRAVYDRTQYALKISANSMYGIVSYRHYNSYSPRCGTSITGSGRWALHVSTIVVHNLGLEVIYGDTDSIMYTIDSSVRSADLIFSYVNHMNNLHADIRLIDVMEFISGNRSAIPSSDVHSNPVCNVVTKVLNKIMSYTCFTGLSVEQQEINSVKSSTNRSFIFPSFMIASKKHYVGMICDGTLYTKGMNYIRKSGSVLSSTITKEFVDIVLKYEDVNTIRLCLSRVCSHYKWKIRSSRWSNILNINMKYLGKRSNYIRVIDAYNNTHKYIESTMFNKGVQIDEKYYLGKIKTSLELVTTPLRIDYDPIYSGHVMGN